MFGHRSTLRLFSYATQLSPALDAELKAQLVDADSIFNIEPPSEFAWQPGFNIKSIIDPESIGAR